MNRKLTDEIFGLIPALVEQGVAKAEIAARYGATRRPTRCKCYARAVACRCARVASGLDAAPYPCPMLRWI